MKQAELCKCETCAGLRAKGLKSTFTAEECQSIREYAARMMAAVRERMKAKAAAQ